MRYIACAAAAVLLLLGAPVALAHQGNPHFRSNVLTVTPKTKGITVSVLNYDDRLEMDNFSGKDVVINDYKGKPYARVMGDRTVEVNTNSEAYYLNDDRYANAKIPPGLGSQPHWKLVDKTGRFQWHDHRAHYMSPATPKQVTDKNRKTFIFDWSVPITIDGQKGSIAGNLYWVPLPSGGSLPMGLIWGTAAVLILLSLLVFFIRRRRGEAGTERSGAPSEAW